MVVNILDWIEPRSAEQCNATHAKGTRVSVILRSGERLSAETETYAQWSDVALMTLVAFGFENQ